MSFLTPLYLIGLLAISLPLILHLIRRMPRGQFAFSSLMFLSPSPPRLTRKSRLDNLLLLLLRAAAVLVLAAAFARPFLRTAAQMGFADLPGRRVAIVVDTSGSMRRAGLWPQVLRTVDRVLADLGPGDDVASYRFDSHLTPLVAFDDVVPQEPGPKAARVQASVQAVTPGWAGSQLGDALVAVADELGKIGEAGRSAARTERQIVLVTDLQEGSQIEPLRTYQWPEDVRLTVHTVAPTSLTNAGLHLAAGDGEIGSSGPARLPDVSGSARVSDGTGSARVSDVFGSARVSDPAATDDRRSPAPRPQDPSSPPDDHRAQEIRVRVSNARESLGEQFALRWETPSGPVPNGEPIRVFVPPGESRVVRVPRLRGDVQADRLVLTGDDHPFDNTLYLVPLSQEEVPIVYLGEDAVDDPSGHRYYLERAFPETPQRRIRWIVPTSGEWKASVPGRAGASPSSQASPAARLVVVTRTLTDDDVQRLRDVMQRGGTVLLVLPAAAAAGLGKLLGADGLQATEAATKDYAMFGQIDFTHPLFAAFADPRFNDFTKIHFWKHRRLNPADLANVPDQVSVLARFDDGDPALLEQMHGAGRLLVLTAGWNPADSQLARSTKFVPLMAALFEQSTARAAVLPQYHVDDPVLLPDLGPDLAEKVWSIRAPDRGELRLREGDRRFEGTTVPGVYELAAGPQRQRFAVNLPGAESRTDAWDAEQLQEWGVPLGRRPTRAELAEQLRQMRDVELEGQQKLWRWLIVVAIGILILETWLAGYLARISARPAEAGL